MNNSLNSVVIMKRITIQNEGQKKIKKINQYVLLKIIGTGASSKVFLAIDTETKLYYAIKIIHLNQSNTSQIRQEIRMIRKIIHPNVIKFKEVLYSKQKSKVYFIIEYSDLGTLSKLIDRGVKLAEEQICSIFKQIIEALAYIHSKKITHQDIKPRNILIFSDGKAKLSDFGVCHSFQSLDLMFAGTPAYQAPEIYDAFDSLDSESNEDNSIDPIKCDIYSLGVSLFESITGHLPFQGNTLFEIADDMRNHPNIEFSESISTTISSSLLKITKDMMNFDPKKRISMNEIISFFSQFQSPIPFSSNEENKIKRERIPEYNPNAPYKVIHAEVCGDENLDEISTSYPTFY